MNEGDRTEYFYPEDAVAPWVFTWVNFRGARQVVAEMIRLHGDVIPLDPHGETIAELKSIAVLYASKGFRDRYHTSESIGRLLCALGRELASVRPPGAGLIQQAVSHLRDHHRRAINIKEVAAGFSCSREHFTRMFTRETGMTPARFLRDLRLQTARQLLAGTRMPVHEVALTSGFASSSQFCRAFRSAFGRPPTSDRGG